MLKKVGKIIRWVISIILAIIILINLTLIIKSEINPDEIPDVFGYTPFIVVTGSMEPEIGVDDVIITKEVEQSELKVGDIISYTDEEDNIVVTHRITKIENENGERVYTTKGDNNNAEDQRKVSVQNVEGKYQFKIPYLGRIAKYAKTPASLIIIVAIIIIIFLIVDIVSRMLRKDENNKET